MKILLAIVYVAVCHHLCVNNIKRRDLLFLAGEFVGIGLMYILNEL